MNNDDRQKLQQWIDAYCDNGLTPAQREAFERLVQRSPALRAELDLQAEIDRTLSRLFAPPAATAAVNGLPPMEHENGIGNGRSGGSPKAHARRSRSASIVAIAASVLLLVSAGYYAWTIYFPQIKATEFVVQRYTLAEAYRNVESRNFEAQWLCENDRQFASTFWYELGQALALGDPAENVTLTGISYTKLLNSPTGRVPEIIARVGDAGAVVFVDRVGKLKTQQEAMPPGLHLHTRVLNRLALYEVSPFESPVLLNLLSEREIPDEWKSRPEYVGGRRPIDAAPTPSAPITSDMPSKWKNP